MALTPGPTLRRYAQILGDSATAVAEHFNAGIEAGEYTTEEVKKYITSEIKEHDSLMSASGINERVRESNKESTDEATG